ncbi:MAG TPA: TonB-dependent receptor, partial [Hymenobacter sp.]
GRLAFRQNTTNLGFSRKFSNLGPLATLNVAFGGEFRVDNFQIGKGEYASYINGGRRVVTGFTAAGFPNFGPAAAGAQVFPGYQPQDEVNKNRTNVAGYVDLESDITEKLLLRAAGRAENYSDFGGNFSGQVAARLSVLDGLALRGSVGNGFTAGGTGQQGFGVAPLKQETSTNYGAGLTARIARTITLTVDAYQIDIADRIVLSSQFAKTNAVGTPPVTIVDQILGGLDVSRVQFFANAVNTRTRGLDIVANERLTLGPKSRLTLTAAANLNETVVRSFNSSSTTINNDRTVGTGNLQNTLFDRQQRTRLENGNPRSKVNLSANYGYGIFGIEARTVRFGEIQFKDADPARSFLDQTFAAKWITDLTLSAQLIKQVGLTVGASNLFNVYPDKFIQNPRNNEFNFSADPSQSYISTLDNTNRGRFVYPANQFGFTGAYYFARVNVTLP